MRQVLISLVLIIFTSFYIFPFEFVFLPGINTKMAMSAFGALILAYDFAKKRSIDLNKDMIAVVILALLISLTSLLSMTYNNTVDPSFLTYPVSMLVWLGGAYFLIRCIDTLDTYSSTAKICNYIIAVCTIQCIIAYIASLIPAVKAFIDSFLGGDEAFMGKAEGRLYGIGASLDPSGLRFSAALAMIAFIGCNYFEKLSKAVSMLYIVAFVIISVIGNMIARSTTIGLAVSLSYILTYSLLPTINKERNFGFVKLLILCLLILVPICIVLYQTDYSFRSNLRFGFEGFFSLFEKGYWQTNSTDILTENMIVFPETLKTWIIGDGYGANPYNIDQNYIGEDFHGFYMGTDVGYLRFIFYFGIIGMFLLIAYICKVAHTCIKAFPGFTWMFLMILGVNLIGWFKVSTDIFVVFAPFLCLCLTGKYEDLSFANDTESESPTNDSEL